MGSGTEKWLQELFLTRKQMSKVKTIYLAILNQGWIRAELAMLLNLWAREAPYNIFLSLPAEKPIQHNRNHIVKKFLETDFDYLMMLDDDIVPPRDFWKLADLDKDIVGGLCFAYKQQKVIPLALQRLPENEREDVKWKYRTWTLKDIKASGGLTEVDAVGTGAIIIARRVLEHPKMKPAFVNYYDKDGLRIEGLDLSFCRRAQGAGFKIYCHFGYPCSHFCDQDLKEIFKQTYGNIYKTNETYGDLGQSR